MADFSHQDLAGSTFESVDLARSRFHHVDLSDVDVRSADLSRVRLRGVEMVGAEIHGEVVDLTVNGVDVMPLVEAELDRRHPERAAMRPDTPDGFRHAWDVLERLWADTVDRARALAPEQLHASVDGEWSFVETLRHLVFASQSWVGRAVLGDPSPWHPLSLPWDEMPDIDGVPRDRDARPGLEEVLALREQTRAMVRGVLEDLTDERLAADTEPVQEAGWPPPQSFPVEECLRIVLNEEWEHRLYAERDLAVLASAG